MLQRIGSVQQEYGHAATLEQLEDHREMAKQKRQAAQYRREHEQESLRDYTSQYW